MGPVDPGALTAAESWVYEAAALADEADVTPAYEVGDARGLAGEDGGPPQVAAEEPVEQRVRRREVRLELRRRVRVDLVLCLAARAR